MRSTATRQAAWWSHPALLWTGFVLVHGIIAVLGAAGPGSPIGDIRGFYEEWARAALDTGHVVGIDEHWVYPIGALAPILLPGLVSRDVDGYVGFWYLLVTLADAAAFALLLGRRSLRAATAGWFWLGLILLLGPVSLGRLDTVSVAVALAGTVLLASRPLLASTLIAFGAWVKAWPAALLLAAFVALRSRWRVLGGTVALSAVVVGVGVALGGAAQLFGPLSDQSGRGLQIESPAATPFLWLAASGASGHSIFYSDQTWSWEVAGRGTAGAAMLWTVLLVLSVVVSALLGVLALRAVVARGAAADRGPLLAALSLALVASLLAFDKVGSPQYQTWYAVPVVLGILSGGRRWRVPALLALASGLLTTVVYPYGYGQFTSHHAWVIAVFTARNVLEFALLGWAFVELVRLLRTPDAASSPQRLSDDRA